MKKITLYFSFLLISVLFVGCGLKSPQPDGLDSKINLVKLKNSRIVVDAISNENGTSSFEEVKNENYKSSFVINSNQKGDEANIKVDTNNKSYKSKSKNVNSKQISNTSRARNTQAFKAKKSFVIALKSAGFRKISSTTNQILDDVYLGTKNNSIDFIVRVTLDDFFKGKYGGPYTTVSLGYDIYEVNKNQVIDSGYITKTTDWKYNYPPAKLLNEIVHEYIQNKYN